MGGLLGLSVAVGGRGQLTFMQCSGVRVGSPSCPSAIPLHLLLALLEQQAAAGQGAHPSATPTATLTTLPASLLFLYPLLSSAAGAVPGWQGAHLPQAAPEELAAPARPPAGVLGGAEAVGRCWGRVGGWMGAAAWLGSGDGMGRQPATCFPGAFITPACCATRGLNGLFG